MPFLHLSFILFFISTLISQSAMDFFSTLFCLAWCWTFWKKYKGSGRKFLSPMGGEAFLLAWFVVTVIGFLLNWNETNYALTRILEFRWVLIFYVMIEVLKEIKPDERMKKLIFYFAGFIATANLFIFFVDNPLVNGMRYGYGEDYVRAGGFFGNPMTFAHSFVLFVIFLMGLSFLNIKNWSKSFQKFAVLVLVLCLSGLMVTFTRGVWVGFACGLSFGILIWRPKYLIPALVSMVIAFGLLNVISGTFKNRLHQTYSEASGTSERKTLWKAHFHIFQQNPIFGAGYGQNTKQLPQIYAELGLPAETLLSHAHNQYLHLAAGTGILGLLSYLSIWIFFLWTNFKLWRDQSLNNWDRGAVLGLLMGQAAFMVGSLTESNFEHSKVRFMVMLLWAYVIYLASKYQRSLKS